MRTATCLAVVLAASPLITGMLTGAPAAHAAPQPDLTSGQWHLAAIGAPQAWQESTGTGVTVAVLDSGIDTTHPDLAGAVAATGIVGYGRELRTIPARDLYDIVGHGTHVAGLIAARADGTGTTGVAPDARIVAAKVIDDNTDSGIRVDWATRMPALLTAARDAGASVVNMSFGTAIAGSVNPADDPLCQGIAASAHLDLVLVAAAGNEGFDGNRPALPAACPGVLSVGATDPDGRPAFFTTYNDAVDISAPGYTVLSTVPSHQGYYALESGTSMASPVVAGVAALLRSAHPTWTADQVTDQLIATARDTYAPGRDTLTGAGIVDAAAALGRPPTRDDGLSLTLTAAPDGIRWRPPARTVTGYTLTLTDHTTGTARPARTYPPSSVFAALEDTDGAPGDWATVTATLADGTTVTETVFPFGPVTGRTPPVVTGLRARPGDGGLLRATWTAGPDILGMVVALQRDGEVLSVTRLSTETGPLPGHLLLPARREPGHDYAITVITYGTTPGLGQTELELPAARPVAWKTRWTGQVAVVTGAIPPSAADQVTGDRITVRIDHRDGTTTTVRVPLHRRAVGPVTFTLAGQDGDRITLARLRTALTLTR